MDIIEKQVIEPGDIFKLAKPLIMVNVYSPALLPAGNRASEYSTTFHLDYAAHNPGSLPEENSSRRLKVKLCKNNNLHYRIEKTYNENNNNDNNDNLSYFDMFFGSFMNLFSNAKKGDDIEYKTYFIYGYVTNDMRKCLCDTNIYHIHNNKILIYCGGTCMDWLHTLCWFYPHLVNEEFCDKYFAHKYKKEDIFPAFEKLNPHWIQV